MTNETKASTSNMSVRSFETAIELARIEKDVVSEYRVHLDQHVCHVWLDVECDFCTESPVVRGA